MIDCRCCQQHIRRKIVLTGGPGAGKTAVLELVRRTLCEHVQVLPEAAGILFGGGFPRGSEADIRRAGQRAIYYVQRELESTTERSDSSIVLCDRGTVDGLAYWPGPDDLFAGIGTTQAAELSHYYAVIHLRCPDARQYNHNNPLRTESAREAMAIDERIAAAWAAHPRRFEVPASHDFFSKARRTIELIHAELPACCLNPVPLVKVS